MATSPTLESDSASSSTKSAKSGTVRTRKLRKQSSTLNSEDNKSLTSFPSLSPENSPKVARIAGKEAATGTPKPKRGHKSSIAALTAHQASFKGRNALFQDSPTNASRDVPGALHLSTDTQIKRLIEKRGDIDLVRQLAEDLAAREAEITRYRWRAEARERELKKMLREVEVSNLDIEKRLRAIETSPNTPSSATHVSGDRKVVDKRKSFANTSDGIGGLMEEAIGDHMGANDPDHGYLDDLEVDQQATVRRGHKKSGDNASSHSSLISDNKSTVKTWKEYFWSGAASKTSRASSLLNDSDDNKDGVRGGSKPGLKRKGLDEELFAPPPTVPASDAASVDSRSGSGKQSSSWTVKLFAGKPNKDIDPKGTTRGTRNPSSESTQVESSAKAALMKVSKKHSVATLRKPTNAVSYDQPASALASSPSEVQPDSNLGPVEMDAILPRGTRPPTLTPFSQNADDSNEYLTDRFGFIYDQRRRKKEAEAFARLAASQGKASKEMLGTSKDSGDLESLNDSLIPRSATPTSQEERQEGKSSKSGKKWQDYLKIATSTFPTELLSHTPSSTNIMTLGNPDMKKSLKRSPTFGDGASQPTTPLSPPSASSVTSGNAEILSPATLVPTTASTEAATTPAQADFEPVKLLLTQLTELHDNLQREKTVKWNEFMRKVRAERRKGDDTTSGDPRAKGHINPEAYMADGEMIGIAEVGNKGKVGRAKYKEFKMLVLGGIPVSLRAKVWAECSGATAARIPGYYDDLVSSGIDDPVIVSQIAMDINRTLTDNVFFRNGPGVEKLNQVLLAYSRRNPEVGYCQGMNLITASLLLIMPTAEDAFWILATMVENILPARYYDHSLLASRADQQVLREYVSELLPKLSAHLEDLSIELEALTFQWFLSLFTDCLTAEALYRVWDVLLCSKDEEGNGGSTFLFQVALALLKLNETPLLACETPGEIYAYLGGEITNHAISIDGLIKASEGLKSHVRRAEVEDRRARWVEFELETIRERERIRNESQANANKKNKRLSADSGVANRDLEVGEQVSVH